MEHDAAATNDLCKVRCLDHGLPNWSHGLSRLVINLVQYKSIPKQGEREREKREGGRRGGRERGREGGKERRWTTGKASRHQKGHEILDKA